MRSAIIERQNEAENNVSTNCKAKHNYLKERYGKNLVADWPEVTDPQKFVFEDIAIAAYLLTIFSRSHDRPVRFIDIGCGNGLLVYLLVKEGHIGKGIDIRRRNIWSRFEGNWDIQYRLHSGMIHTTVLV